MTRTAVDVPFTWRGLVFTPIPTLPGFWRTALVQLGDFRTADWKVQRNSSSWYARLRVGSDRFPGRGPTVEAALDDAADEALRVACFIQGLVPLSSGARATPSPAAPRPRHPTHARAGAGLRTRSESRKGTPR